MANPKNNKDKTKDLWKKIQRLKKEKIEILCSGYQNFWL